MNIFIKNEPGGIVQQTDKPIVNVFGDVNVKDKDIKEGTADDEIHDLVDLKFFSMKKYGTIESQELLRKVLKSATPKMDVNSGRDWVAVYIAYHYAEGVLKVMKRQADFFHDIDVLLPGILTKVKQGEGAKTLDQRYKSYSDLLRKECGNWFIQNECLPPMNEWTTQKYRYHVDDERRKAIQNLVTEIYQGLNS